MVERICDYFAGCLLMPRPWVKRIYCSGRWAAPARPCPSRIRVSQAAISVRLSQIGLVDPTPRCAACIRWLDLLPTLLTPGRPDHLTATICEPERWT